MKLSPTLAAASVAGPETLDPAHATMPMLTPIFPSSLPSASMGERFTAQLIDGLAALGVGVLMYLLTGQFHQATEFVVLGWIVYLLLCDGMPQGQSLGKRFTKSAVIHIATGRPCNGWRSLVRNLPLLVLGFLDLIFIMGPQRRRLGDRLAGTRVVRLM